jgi:hypothetical protein
MIRAVIDEGGAPVAATSPALHSIAPCVRATTTTTVRLGAHLGAHGRNAPHAAAGRVLRLALVLSAVTSAHL